MRVQPNLVDPNLSCLVSLHLTLRPDLFGLAPVSLLSICVPLSLWGGQYDCFFFNEQPDE